MTHILLDNDQMSMSRLAAMLNISNGALTEHIRKLEDVTTDSLRLDYQSDIRFRFAVEPDAKHVGGITLFGQSFGNYDQDIRVSMTYAPLVCA